MDRPDQSHQPGQSDQSDRSDRPDPSDKSDKSDGRRQRPRLIPTHGGYRKLRSFQCAQLVYDATVIFCERFVDKRSRTHDQMVQAARSGVQNIAAGSPAGRGHATYTRRRPHATRPRPDAIPPHAVPRRRRRAS